MEYIPPSDPEDDCDDYDAEDFFCIPPNTAKPVNSFSQPEIHGDTEYATLHPVHLGNTSPGKYLFYIPKLRTEIVKNF